METLKLLGHEILIEDDLISFNNARTQFKTNITYAEENVLETYETYIKYLDDSIIDLVKFDIDKAHAIFSNVKEHIKDKDEGVKHIVECIKNYPYNLHYYTYLIDSHITDTKDIVNLASYFGYNKEILDYEMDFKRLKMQEFLNMNENNKQDVEDKIFEIKTNSSMLDIDYSNLLKTLECKLEFIIQRDNIPETKEKIEELISLEKFNVLNDLIKNDNPYAQQSLYCYYFNEENFTPNELFNKFKDEDKADNAFNIYILSQCYYRGYGTGQDTTKALDILNKAVELGSLFARLSLGYYYMEGYCSIDVNHEVGGILIEECVEKGLPAAQACLGSFYRAGKKGYNQDLKKAEELLTLAAEYD